MHSCPALAYERDPGTGAVLIRADSCIGCRYCSWACPYGAPQFEPDTGVMGKCTFCSHRLSDGLKPACAALCPTGALDYAELPTNQLTADIEGFPHTDLGPSIRILPRSGRAESPLLDPAIGGRSNTAETELNEPSIRLSSECSLAGFTFLLAVLFGLLTVGVTDTREVPPIAFAIVGAIAALLSLTHLGKPSRAWRAILNVRRSPVSREVLGFGGMAALGTLSLAWPPGAVATGLGWSGLAAGFLALISADRVYRPVFRPGHPVLDDGGVLLTGLYLAGLGSGIGWLAAPIGALKLYLYVRRLSMGTAARIGSAWRWPGAAIRIGLGLVVPGALWVTSGVPLSAWVLACALIGEAVGRAEFYSRLEIVSPARQLRLDLETRIATYEAGPAIRSTASANSS